MSNFATAAITIVGVIAGILFLSFVWSYPLMLLWNGCLVGAVTIVKPVTWLQMWGISVLVGFMFKSTASSK